MFFFFFKQKTAYEMRISDWSSDVCSSDLPQDRASYFKALLEVTDLEDFRNQVAAIEKDIPAPAEPLAAKLETAAGIAGAGRFLKPLLAKVPAAAELSATLAACAKELVTAQGEAAPADPAALFARLAAILADKRAKTFALKGFDRKRSDEHTSELKSI